MERSPEAARIGREISRIIYEKKISRTMLAERVGRLTGERPGPMWVARRVKGQIHLTKPQLKVVGLYESDKVIARYEPNDELVTIANALDVDPNELAAAAREPEPTAATA